ncbi:hypothetical protein C7S16_6748 [Burkholderia thailandensis]|uniref:Uncharacterized protein n=1 Tax=Burkholderia thailandensis TaxID=57975 RepID=A0AAW9CJC8_BURTH|nr:hypothetical protein [Burkholderia thailandensis]
MTGALPSGRDDGARSRTRTIDTRAMSGLSGGRRLAPARTIARDSISRQSAGQSNVRR